MWHSLLILRRQTETSWATGTGDRQLIYTPWKVISLLLVAFETRKRIVSWQIKWEKFEKNGEKMTLWYCHKWALSSEFGTYRLCEQRRFRRACASVQSRQNLRCSLIQAVSQEEPSDRKPDPWPLWMAGHAQLKFFMMECSKTQIRLTRLKYSFWIQDTKHFRCCFFCHRYMLHIRDNFQNIF